MACTHRTTILIADDHRLVLDGIRTVLGGRDQFEVVGEAPDGTVAVQQAGTLKPDILLLDVSMPGISGIEAVLQVREVSPRTRVLMYSMNASAETVLSLFRAGISGYVLKDDPLKTLLNALSTVAEGGTYYSRSVVELLNDHRAPIPERREDRHGPTGKAY